MPKASDLPRVILKYISDYEARFGFPPSIREICAGIGICSPSTVQRHVTRMKERGILIGTRQGCSRALAISSRVQVETGAGEAKHLCLQTDDGGMLILNCRSVNGRLDFRGPIRATGFHGVGSKVIACRELNEDYYDEAMMT